MNEWRDSQNPGSKGCGCATLVGIGLLACGFLMGSMMGDYIGPPEGAAQNAHQKNITVLLSLIALVLCITVGNWLVKKRKP